jgi:hypothetical protein
MRIEFSFDQNLFANIPEEGQSGWGIGKGWWDTTTDTDGCPVRCYTTGSARGKYFFRADGRGWFEGRRNSFWAGSAGVTISPRAATAQISRYYDDESYAHFEMDIQFLEVRTSTPEDIVIEGVPHLED